jgi:hypothetical protein
MTVILERTIVPVMEQTTSSTILLMSMGGARAILGHQTRYILTMGALQESTVTGLLWTTDIGARAYHVPTILPSMDVLQYPVLLFPVMKDSSASLASVLTTDAMTWSAREERNAREASAALLPVRLMEIVPPDFIVEMEHAVLLSVGLHPSLLPSVSSS